MKKIKFTFSKKILLLLFASIGFTILFSFFFIDYLYSKLYLTSIEESIIHQGQRTASHYHYGELSEDIIEKIQWYNIVSEYEIVVVDELDQLSSFFPYQVNYGTLINPDDRSLLENGKYVIKEGYVEEFGREIIGAIFPIKGEDQLIGFIYIYVPLAALQDVFRESIPILLLTGILFFFILFLIVNQFWQSLFNPLKKLQQQAVEVSKGNYTVRLESHNDDDEVGQLTAAFNSMSDSLAQQEVRKKEFTSNIVHELRTPLTYIRGYTEALKQKNYTSAEQAGDYLTTIEKESERLNKLINDLIELNHLQEEFYTLDKQPMAIAQVLFDTLDLFTIRIDKAQLTLKLDIEEDPIISGDSQRIQQVFYNVIDNAIKYSKPKGTIFVSLIEVDDTIQFQVQNHGIIIESEDIHRIGERFFRTDKARNRTTGGTGLGLSIVKEITRVHNGKFEMTSTITDGTIVTIQLPKLK